MRALIISAYFIIALALFCSCDNADRRDIIKDETVSSVSPTFTAEPSTKVPSTINSLDNPTNPYAGQYSEVDELVHSELALAKRNETLSGITEKARKLTGNNKYKPLLVYVDAQGNLLPTLHCTRLRQEFFRSGDRSGSSKEAFKDYFQLMVPVTMSDDEYLIFREKIDSVVATYFPPIPGWLYQAPPAGGAIIYPSGDVLTYGPLGSWVDEDEQDETHSSSHHGGEVPTNESGYSVQTDLYLHDSAGKLKNSTAGASTDPLSMYVEPAEGGLGKEAEPYWGKLEFERTLDGYVVGKDRNSGKTVIVIDYDGTTTLTDKYPAQRDRHNFMIINPSQIRRFHEAQSQ